MQRTAQGAVLIRSGTADMDDMGTPQPGVSRGLQAGHLLPGLGQQLVRCAQGAYPAGQGSVALQDHAPLHGGGLLDHVEQGLAELVARAGVPMRLYERLQERQQLCGPKRTASSVTDPG